MTLTIKDFDDEVHKRMKSMCALQGRTIMEYVLSTIDDRVKKDEEELKHVFKTN